MINWEELKHIHVIRKLESILAQWFHTDIYFVDSRGTIRNSEAREFRNPLTASYMTHEKGREFICKAIADANYRAQKSDQTHLAVDGPFGFEKMLLSRIVIDGEFWGTVCAFAYCEKQVSPEQKAKSRAQIQSFGMDAEAFESAVSRMKPMSEGEKKYFFELIDLVAQEIVTFHTEISKREEKINALNSQLGVRYSYDKMIGKSKPMQELYAMLDKIKKSESTVLIQGENGTGKELIARAVHFNSPRAEAPFVAVNCSAIPETLIESELFGYIKGAFTGAMKDKKGLFEAAHGGTIFLDEIGDMPVTMQVKLLRTLQEGTFTPVGGTDMRKVDVRVVAATNKDLKEMVELGTFREDFYFRINVINITVPPLRDRKEDIPMLVDAFLERGCKEKSVPLKQLAKRAMEKILDYAWPGNIRELENEVERLIVLSGDEQRVSADLLSQRIRDFGENAKVQGVRVSGKLKDALEELEKTMIREGLRRTNWNKSRLAKELGISRAGLIMKVEKYGLDKRKLPRGPGLPGQGHGGGDGQAA